MLPIGTYKGGYTYACNEYDEKYFNEIVSKFFVNKYVAPVLPPTKPDPYANFFDDLLKGELSFGQSQPPPRR